MMWRKEFSTSDCDAAFLEMLWEAVTPPPVTQPLMMQAVVDAQRLKGEGPSSPLYCRASHPRREPTKSRLMAYTGTLRLLVQVLASLELAASPTSLLLPPRVLCGTLVGLCEARQWAAMRSASGHGRVHRRRMYLPGNSQLMVGSEVSQAA